MKCQPSSEAGGNLGNWQGAGLSASSWTWEAARKRFSLDQENLLTRGSQEGEAGRTQVGRQRGDRPASRRHSSLAPALCVAAGCSQTPSRVSSCDQIPVATGATFSYNPKKFRVVSRGKKHPWSSSGWEQCQISHDCKCNSNCFQSET